MQRHTSATRFVAIAVAVLLIGMIVYNVIQALA